MTDPRSNTGLHVAKKEPPEIQKQTLEDLELELAEIQQKINLGIAEENDWAEKRLLLALIRNMEEG